MSMAKKTTSKKPPQITPLIGALLRLPHEVGPDGRRPIDLARQCNMTRQAMNYVLAGLESRGYIERQAEAGKAERVVRLTDRGWEVISQIRRSVAEIEQQWIAYLGAQRFKVLSETLRDLSLWLEKLP